MPLSKICPVCKTENKAESIICKSCMTDISSIEPKDIGLPTDKPENVSQKKPDIKEETNNREQEKQCILIQFENQNDIITLYNGDIIGRHHKGKEILEKYKTISRKHIVFSLENNKWYIQDLNSSNYTYLNKEKLNPGKKYGIKEGDMVSMAEDINFKILQIK